MEITPLKIMDFSKVCRITSPIGCCYPIPQLYQAYKTGDNSQLPNLTYLLITMNQIGWMVYGRMIDNSTLFWLSLIGAGVYGIYSTFMLILKKSYRRIAFFYLFLIIEAIIVVNSSVYLQGTISLSFQVMGSLMNIELIQRGVKQYNGAIFNRASLMIALINGFAWCIYSIQILDYFVMIPIFLDTIINILQLTLHQILPHPLLNKVTESMV